MYKKLILAAIGAAAVAALAACSSTGGGTTTSPTPSASDGAPSFDNFTIKTAQSTGKDFSSGGIDWMLLHTSDLPAGLSITQNVTGQVAQALATGDVDIATTSPSRLLPAMLQGLPVTIVGTTEEKWDPVVVVGKEYAGDVKNPCDIKGAKVGITAAGSAGDLTTLSWAKKCGFTEGVDFTKVALGDGNALAAAFEAGQINFNPYGGLNAFNLIEKGYPSFNADLYVDMPTSVIAVRNDFLARTRRRSRPSATRTTRRTHSSGTTRTRRPSSMRSGGMSARTSRRRRSSSISERRRTRPGSPTTAASRTSSSKA